MNGITSTEKHLKGQTTENAKPAVTLRFRAASAAVSTAATAVEQEQQPSTGDLPPWEKVLWRKQPYPDNYVDDSFLQHMVSASSSSWQLLVQLPTRQHLHSSVAWFGMQHLLGYHFHNQIYLLHGFASSQVAWHSCALHHSSLILRCTSAEAGAAAQLIRTT